MNASEEVRKIAEKRKLKRFSDRLKISFSVNGITYRGLLINFSLSGLFIKTKYSFPPGIPLDIIIYLPNKLTSHLKGRIVRASNETFGGMKGKARGYEEKGIGVELIEEDSLYLHFIRSFVSVEGKHIFRQLAFTEQDQRYQEIEVELQEKCHLFDIVAVVIDEESKQTGIKGKAWLEAKIKNNTDHVFMQPVVTFITTKDSEDAQNGKGKRPPQIGAMLMSSSDNLSHWRPGETIILDGEIDPSSEDIPIYELKFFDYLTKTPEFAVDLPMRINDYVSTLWIGSPYLNEIDENIPDSVPFELLQPSPSAHEIETLTDDSAKSDDTPSEDFLLLSSPARARQYNSFDNDFQHQETNEALNNIKISDSPVIGLKHEQEASSQNEKNDNSFDGGHQIAQENINKLFENPKKSISAISKWIIFVGFIIIASLSILNLFIDKGYRQSLERQTLVIPSLRSIAPGNGTERKEAALQRQREQEGRRQVETKTPQGNKQNTVLRQTVAIRAASVNKDLKNSQSNKRSRQNFSAAVRYPIQIGLTVHKKGQGTVTDTGGGALIDCGSICSTLVNGALYLAATPEAGSIFVKWSGCDRVDVNKICMVNMVSKDRAVTAVFKGGDPIGNTKRGETLQAGPE